MSPKIRMLLASLNEEEQSAINNIIQPAFIVQATDPIELITAASCLLDSVEMMLTARQAFSRALERTQS